MINLAVTLASFVAFLYILFPNIKQSVAARSIYPVVPLHMILQFLTVPT